MNNTVGYALLMRVSVKPEKREEFVGLIKALRDNVKANEPDTLVYEMLQGDNPNEFVFYECFTDEAAFERHRDMDYHVAMSDAGYACLDGEPQMEFLHGAWVDGQG